MSVGLREHLILFFNFFLLGAAAFADPSWKETVHGDFSLDSIGYRDQVTPTNRFLEVGRLGLDGTAKYGKLFKFKAAPVLQADPLNHSVDERYWIELPEGYGQVQDSGFTLQVGMNTFNWGVTDGYNPLDVVSARRYQDPLKTEKLGAPSAYLKKEIDNVSFEAIYIPWQRRSILPGDHSRWLPREVYASNGVYGGQSAVLFLPDNLNYAYQAYQIRDQALTHNVGGRMQVTGLLSGLDFSLQAFEGAAGTPAVDLNISGNATFQNNIALIRVSPNVGLIPVYYRQQMAGASFVYANFGMIFRAEGAITRVISRGADLPGHADEWVFGIEKPIPVGANDLTVLLEGTYARHEEPLSNSTTSLDRIFDRAAILGLRYPFSEKLTALFTGLFDTESKDELAHGEATYALSDAWKVGGAFDLLWGDPATPLGSYRRNDRLTLTVKTAF